MYTDDSMYNASSSRTGAWHGTLLLSWKFVFAHNMLCSLIGTAYRSAYSSNMQASSSTLNSAAVQLKDPLAAIHHCDCNYT